MLKGLWQSSWKLLGTKISFGDSVQSGVDTTKAVLDLSKAIGENRTLDELAPMIGHLSSILDVLNLPIVQLAGSALPFVSIASKLLQFYLESTKEDPSLEDCVELVGQAAYLESFKNFFNRDENKHLLEKLQKTGTSDRLQKKISQLSKNLTLTEAEARSVLLCFHESKLASELNLVVLARLVDAGMVESEAKIVVERISRMTHREIKPALAEIKDKVTKLSVIYGSDWQRELETYDSIDHYLKEIIAQKPCEKVFDEDFGFKDIYVELQIEPIAKDGSDGQHQGIEEWALSLLNDESKSGQVLFIQGEPGRGKSVFCRMFSDRVRRELYPIWTPILIRLRDITNFADDFDTLLEKAVDRIFASGNWLRNRNNRFLFLLDGFDELLLEHSKDTSLKNFLDRLSDFQTQCDDNNERGHRVIITGRPLALFGIQKEMPDNLKRVRIVDMSPEAQSLWLQKWGRFKGANNAQAFGDFLHSATCPKQVKTLAKEPLLLYLLADMYADGQLKIEALENAGNNAKIWIYDQTINCVLTKQRSNKNKNLNRNLTGLEIEEIRYILKEAGLCVVQRGGVFTSLDSIKARLSKKLVEKLDKIPTDQTKDKLPVALATFYLKSGNSDDNSLEFVHRSFGEFLCAERFIDSLIEWSQLKVDQKALEWEIYDLFGFGALTDEVVEYLTALIEKEFAGKDTDLVRLFERLYEFYWTWSNGIFIDEIDSERDCLPLQKARLMKKQDIVIGQRKIDVYTGLNMLILLLTLNRYVQEKSEIKDKIVFSPCTSADTKQFDPTRLLHIINYSECYEDIGFLNIVGRFLGKTHLRQIDLHGIDLGSANLSGADLGGADLRRTYLGDTFLDEANLCYADLCYAELCDANLGKANLSHAKLYGASLRGTNFRSANLSNSDLGNVELWESCLCNANLSCANLSDSNLYGANLCGADLSEANLTCTDLSNVIFDEFTKWSNVIGLNESVNIPDNLAVNPQFRAAVLLCNGFDLISNGDVDRAITAYKEAQHLYPSLEISVYFWDRLGWFGSLYNRAADVLFACEKALEVEPSDWLRDTRGLALALTGNLDGAIADFEAAINSGELEGEFLEKRECWLEALKSGINPFTPEELEALRASEGNQ